MSAGASPYALLRRALDAGRLDTAEMAARECPHLDLTTALELVMLMQRDGDARYEKAATRWLGRFLADKPEVGLEVAAELAESFAELNGVMPDVARSRVALLLQQAGLGRASDSVAGG